MDEYPREEVKSAVLPKEKMKSVQRSPPSAARRKGNKSTRLSASPGDESEDIGPPPAQYDFEKMIEEALKNSGEAVPAVKPMGD
jgi:hypothetical protein